MLKSVEKCETPILDVKIWDPQFSTFGPNETLVGISSRQPSRLEPSGSVGDARQVWAARDDRLAARRHSELDSEPDDDVDASASRKFDLAIALTPVGVAGADD